MRTRNCSSLTCSPTGTQGRFSNAKKTLVDDLEAQIPNETIADLSDSRWLLCWVSEPLCERADARGGVNPEECIRWQG